MQRHVSRLGWSGPDFQLKMVVVSIPEREMPRHGEIETKRTVLRPFREGDVEPFASIYSDPEVTRFLGFDEGSFDRSRRELEFWMKTYTRQGHGMLGVIHKEDGSLIGRCGFAKWEWDGVQETELSCVLRRSLWGQGIATETTSALRDFGFGHCGFKRMVSLLHPENTASHRVAEKIGMRFEREAHSITQRLWIYSLCRPA